MAFTPIEFTDGVTVAMAYTPGEVSQFRWEGWWALGEVEPPLSLAERMRFGPTPPAAPRRGTVYIATPV